MAPVTPARDPGSMTVSFLFGWQHILTGLVLLIVVAVLFLLVLGSGVGRSGRAEWRAELDARSRSHRNPTVEPYDDGAEPVRAGRTNDPEQPPR
jgi:hypothetical protein